MTQRRSLPIFRNFAIVFRTRPGRNSAPQNNWFPKPIKSAIPFHTFAPAYMLKRHINDCGLTVTKLSFSAFSVGTLTARPTAYENVLGKGSRPVEPTYHMHAYIAIEHKCERPSKIH